MKKYAKLRAVLDGILIALPVSAAFVVAALSINIMPLGVFISILLTCWAVVEQLRIVSVEKSAYRKQEEFGKFYDPEKKDSLVFAVFFFVFGAIGCVGLGLILFRELPETKYTLRVSAFLVGLACLAYVVFVVKPLLRKENYTGYKIISGFFSKADVFEKSEENVCWSVQAMIYGDENSPENQEILKTNARTFFLSLG